MESFRSNTEIDKISIGSVNKYAEYNSNQMCNNNNWRNFVKIDSYCDSISSESSGNTRPIDENSNALSEIAEEFEDLIIDTATINVKAASIESSDKNPEENLSKFEDLRINSNTVKKCKIHQLAGKIDSIAVSMGIALVKPAVANRLLDTDTPLFVCLAKLPIKNSVPSDCTLVGHIDDVFGPVGSPMYSVRLEPDIYELLKAQAEIHYLENHPNTTLIRVEERNDKTFRLIRTKSH